MLEQLLARIRANDPTVTKIDLSDNAIGAAGAKALAEALKTNSSVTEIDLSENYIRAAGAQALANALKLNTTVTTIDLRGNNIGNVLPSGLGAVESIMKWTGILKDSGAQSLAEALKINTSVTTINLKDNNIGAAGAQALAEALKTNTSVTWIGLSANTIGDAGKQAVQQIMAYTSRNWLEQLLQRIRANDPSLTKIVLHDNNFGDADVHALFEKPWVLNISLSSNNIGDAGAQALAEALKTNTSLTEIDFCINEIGDAGAQALAEALKTNTTVTKIDLGCNNIGAAGAQALAEALKTNTTVTKIDLGGNNIGAAGAQAVEQINDYVSLNILEQLLLPRIRANDPTVTKIDLSDNAIGAAGAKALAEALKTNTSVTTINLYGNFIRAAGAQALAEALKTNTSVTTINLYGNFIRAAGAQALAEALKTNTSVTTINLYGNFIRAAGAQALAEALKTNTSVTTINLYGNFIGDAGTQALAEALKTNNSVTTIDLAWNNIEAAGKQAEKQIYDYLRRNRTNARKLIDAVQNNDATAVTELLVVGASVNYQDEKDKTALHYAIQEGRLEIVYLLLNSPQLSKNKTAPSLVNEFSNENGNTLLHQAVLFAENNPEIAHKLVERLLACGAKRYVKNHAGQYPFQLFIPATTEENPELAAIRNLLKPNPAEQLFIDHIVNNPHIKPLIEKLSKTLIAMDELMVTLRSDKTKQKYQLPGDLVVRLLFEELQLLRTHIEQNDFDCEEESAWEQFFATCLSNYENMTNNLSASQVSHQPEILTDNESALLKELILKLQQINQLIFQDTQASSHRDKLIQNICIPREWVEEYELSLAETQTSKKRKREAEDLKADGIATADDAEELSAKRQKTDDLSMQELQNKVHKLEQDLALSHAKIAELEQRHAKLQVAKDSENTSSHSMAYFPTLQK